MTYSTIELTRHDAVALVRLNRPQALNALNSQVLEELIDAFALLEADPQHRCAVVTGAGDKAFAAGADIKEMADKSLAEFYGQDWFSGWTDRFARAVRKPWIAAVNGFALGGGCELAMMADFIIASDKARFGQPEIKLGVLPGMGGSQRLTRAVGKAKAMDLVLTGRMMDAAEAERAGLVARIAPHDSLLDEALAAARTIAGMAPLAALANKEAVEAAFETTLEAGIKYERRLFHMIAGTADKAEGMAAFIEKRDPVWQGK